MREKTLTTLRIRSAAGLEPYRDAWRALADGAPMRSPGWMLSWWQYYAGTDDELCVLLCLDPQGALVGLAPLYLSREARGKTALRLLGSGDASTNHTTWLAASGFEPSVVREVSQFLLGLGPDCKYLELESVDADDRAINATVASLAEQGYLVRKIPRHSCWSIELPSTWEEYLSMLSRSRRKRCRKLQREFLHSGLVKIHRVSCEKDFSKGFKIMLDLHAERWGDRANPLGGFSDETFRRFHETAARTLLGQKKLHLTWLEYKQTPIAAEYQFVDQNSVYSYQAGMDPAITEFPPGNLSIMASINFAISQGYKWFDFARGDQPYKANWRAKPTACHDIFVWPDTCAGRFEYFKCGASSYLEANRLKLVRRLKARLPHHYITALRQLLCLVDGTRRGPRKVSA